MLMPKEPAQHIRLPQWLKNKYRISELRGVKSMLRGHRLRSVCEEARCPNKAECFSRPTAAFLILGDKCTRACSFCSVAYAQHPSPLDMDEPERVAEAVSEMGLRYVVVTSVTRDDLPDGGAGHFANTVKAIKETVKECAVEILIPDFKGSAESLKKALASGTDVLNHNIETVPSLYAAVRPQAVYARSLDLLALSKSLCPDIKTKSGMMLGLGESMDEVEDALKDLRSVGCDMLTIGQYMRPGRKNLPVKEYINPVIFDKLKDVAYEMGFSFVASAPMVRSSMNAEEMFVGF